MMSPELKKALGPYLRAAFDSWRESETPGNAVMILQGSDGVSIYCMSVQDCQLALAEADHSQAAAVAKMALTLATPPGEGRFWILYMMTTCMGLMSLRWREYVSRSFN